MCVCVCAVDVEVTECLLRPHVVKTYTLTIPDVGVAQEVMRGWVIDEGGNAVTGNTGEQEVRGEVTVGVRNVSPSLGSHSIWAAQPTNKIPGHTGYLTMATLH